jgi:ketosteroid isomerase-like protein
MKNRTAAAILLTALVMLGASCKDAVDGRPDLVKETFPEAQAELRRAVDAIGQDILTAHVAGLQNIHLRSDKFTKFGPRVFDRQDVESTNQSEATFWASVSATRYEARDRKIDVFGELAVVTYYPHVTFVRDGKPTTVNGRQTLVFLRTTDGWKIVHEHGTVRSDSL